MIHETRRLGAPSDEHLQTEPQLQVMLGVVEEGHDSFERVDSTIARTGGDSPAGSNQSR